MPGPTTVRLSNRDACTWRPYATPDYVSRVPNTEPPMPATTKKFWVVWNPPIGLPKVRHESRDSAQAEATRLASQNHGQAFHVLQLVGTARTVNVEFIEAEDPDEVPY